DIIKNGFASACHDIADGGLIVALVEMLMSDRNQTELGISFKCDNIQIALDHFLFSEAGGFILEIPDEYLHKVETLVSETGAYGFVGGKVTKDGRIKVLLNGNSIIDLRIEDVQECWRNGLEGFGI
ncbi:hypothetical protein JW979_14805, partial [bacterium]|nr:hypothetical protein [candidate division CSSED10-310 bacterium]